MKIIRKIIRKIVSLVSTIVLLIICGFFYARFIEPNMLITKNITMEAEGLEQDCKIVFFSDTHFGELYPQENIERIVEKINEQEADVVVFGGDFFDTYYKEQELLDLDYLKKQLTKIEANYAKIAVWGNHDVGGGSARIYPELFEESGFILLKNETAYIKDLNMRIRGLDDYLLGNPDKSTEMFKKDNYNVIVSHAPDIVDLMDGSKTNLLLSGHSHGGQVFVPYLTEKILPVGARTYTKGLYEFKNERDSKLYVTKGLGVTQIPYRFLNIPEIVVIELQAK